MAGLVIASVMLGGCDVWERFADGVARLVATAFLIALAATALGGGAGLFASVRRPPTNASVVLAWAVAITTGFVVFALDQFIPDLRRHAPWVAFLPALGLPAGAFAIVGSARLARARGLHLGVVAALGVVGAGYVAWLALVASHGLG